MDVTRCPFCEEFNNVESSEFRKLFPKNILPHRFIKITDRFVVLAGLGAIKAGYTLIVPKKHVRSFSLLSRSDASEAQQLKDLIVGLVKSKFSEPIVFEHGSGGEKMSAGACIDHAHLHVVPTKADLYSKLKQEFGDRPIKHLADLTDLSRQKQRYLYYERNGEGHAFIVNKNLPAQYVRRLVASAEGKPDEWDWYAFLEKQNLIQTVKELGTSH